MPLTPTDVAPPATAVTTAAFGAELLSAVAAESNEELVAGLEEDFSQMAAAQGRVAARLGEVERREAFRDEGATSTSAWVAERFGVSVPTARALAHVGEKALDLPHLVGAVCAGQVSLDKVRALADVATPESDQELCAAAKEHSVRELAEVARTSAARHSARPGGLTSAEQHERRFVRFNDALRTMTAQLPAESYAEAKACLETRAKAIATDGQTPWDHRLCDGFTGMVRSSASGGSEPAESPNPYFVVVHVPIKALVEESGQTTELAGELEHDGLIDGATVKKVACDATVVVAVDDKAGHTMYEGRARRFPSGAQRREVRRRDRECRFPGCANVTFAEVHHIVEWKPGGGTDLPNLVFLCEFHHRLVHRNGWTMTGNANEELTIVGPTGRVMVSRPSALWTRVTAGQ
ncbi:MAG TPA: DUF222 domain-containing protein [Acidimicrobiales bacterium]|nr:DUF222 domain-containing protein [Acidimicrobiales bacterium]